MPNDDQVSVPGATDAPATVSLTREQCFALVAAASYGRIVYTVKALPAITPVRFIVDDGMLLFDVTAGSVLAQTARGGVLAFHVDFLDVDSGLGWTVTMTGRTTHVSEQSADPVTVALAPTLVTGYCTRLAPPRARQFASEPDARP